MKTRFFAGLAVLLGLLAVTTGCASISRQGFDRIANPAIKKIAVLEVRNPKRYRAVKVSGPLYAFGAVGVLLSGLAAAGGGVAAPGDSSEFTRKLNEQEIVLGSRLNKTIELWLKQQGYDVSLISSKEAADVQNDESDTVSYSRLHTDADAILDVRIEAAGYIWFLDSSSVYTPFMNVKARLISAKSGAQMYSQIIIYGVEGAGGNIDVEYISGTGSHVFGSFSKLMANVKEAQEGMAEGGGPVARRIAYQLGKAPAAVTPPPSEAPAAVTPPPSEAPAAVTPPPSEVPAAVAP